MSSIQSNFINLVVTLLVITLVASLALGFVHKWTQEPIAKAQLEKQLNAIESVLKGYDNNPVLEKYNVAVPDGYDSLEFFPAKKDGVLIGMAVKTKSSRGYNGNIVLMVGFNLQGQIQNISVIDHKETPGLGSKISAPAFIKQFQGKNPDEMKLRVKKDGGDVDAISGATITTRAYAEAVQLAYNTFKSTQHGPTR